MNNLKYIHKFFQKACCRDLLELKLYPPNATPKEISECFAMREAAIQHLNVSLTDPNIICICPGDGGSPRLATTIVFTTQWSAISIDPELQKWLNKWDEKGPKTSTIDFVRNLTVLPNTVESIRGKIKPLPTQKVIILACHSHAILPSVLKIFSSDYSGFIDLIAMPCCVKQELNQSPDIEYRDEGIFSPHNLIKIWKNIKIN